MNGAARCDAMGYPSPAEVWPSHLRAFLREITGPESRRSGWRMSKSRSQIGTSRRSSIFVLAGVRSRIRLSHWKALPGDAKYFAIGADVGQTTKRKPR